MSKLRFSRSAPPLVSVQSKPACFLHGFKDKVHSQGHHNNNNDYDKIVEEFILNGKQNFSSKCLNPSHGDANPQSATKGSNNKGSYHSNANYNIIRTTSKNFNTSHLPGADFRDHFTRGEDLEIRSSDYERPDFLPEASINPDNNYHNCEGSKHKLTSFVLVSSDKLDSKCTTLPVTGGGTLSSDPDPHNHLDTKKTEGKIRFLQRTGDNHYISSLNHQIYHLSNWLEGESSSGGPSVAIRDTRRRKRDSDNPTSSDSLGSNPQKTKDRNWCMRDKGDHNKFGSKVRRSEISENFVWKPP